MDTLFLYNTKTLKEKFKTKVFAGDNHITKINVQIPDNIGGYPKRECEFNLRAIIPEGNLSYMINPSQPYFYITNDITEKAQTVKLMMIITHDGNVIGRTNTVDLTVNEPAEAPDPPLTPREEFDEVIAEQRAEIAEQAETISTQSETITQQGEQITELSGEVSTLQGTVAEQSATITRQNSTIDELNRRVPPLETLDPINPTTEQVTYNPESPNIGFPQVVVNPVSAEGVDFHSEWYKEGEECLGEIGSYNPFPEHSYGGIYYTELGEGGYPKKILIKDMLRSADTIPRFFNTSVDAKRELREVVFENCPQFLTLTQFIFQGFNYLTKVILPNSLTSISQSAFSDCSSLTDINLPDSLTRLINGAFYHCSRLTKLTLPNSLTSIDSEVFSGCSSLTDINLPDSLTSIGTNAFSGCSSLTDINLPDSLTSIGTYAFYACSRLTNLTIAQGFNCNGLNVSFSTRFTAETIVSCLEALADRTGQTAYTITFGSTNLNKLTAEQIAIATNKNWNLA